MKNNKLASFWLISLLAVTAASFYPLYMGVRVVCDMIANGVVMKENYPKYIIPYTPIASAVIVGVLLMPLFVKHAKKFALAASGAVSVAVFFALEVLFENKVVVQSFQTVVRLQDWQMYMCFVPYETESVRQTPVDILVGDYNPAFKLHFYLISLVIILTALNALYGFARMAYTGEKGRKKALILQAVSSFVFLGMCILACFTAFWRTGSIRVSPLSACLMCAFFVLLGVTVGLFVGSFLLKQKPAPARFVPAGASLFVTLLMYIGELILLDGHLYRFGEGFFFDPLPGIVAAPADVLVVLASGIVMFLIMVPLTKQPCADR